MGSFAALIGPRSHMQTQRNLRKLVTRKQKNYVMTKSTPTLTQSGLLAVLLQRQHYKVIQLARRRAQRKHARAVLWSNVPWLLARTHRAIARWRLRRPFVGTFPACRT